MDNSDKHVELIKTLEHAREVADQLNDEVAVSLVERALRHAHTISDFRPTKPLSGLVPREP